MVRNLFITNSHFQMRMNEAVRSTTSCQCDALLADIRHQMIILSKSLPLTFTSDFITNYAAIPVNKHINVCEAYNRNWIHYAVKRSDTLERISIHFKVNSGEIRTWNNLRSTFIHEGQLLKILPHVFEVVLRLDYREKYDDLLYPDIVQTIQRQNRRIRHFRTVWGRKMYSQPPEDTFLWTNRMTEQNDPWIKCEVKAIIGTHAGAPRDVFDRNASLDAHIGLYEYDLNLNHTKPEYRFTILDPGLAILVGEQIKITLSRKFMVESIKDEGLL